MKSKEWLNGKRNWPVFVLLILFVPALWWWRIWSSGVLLKWWLGQEGVMPPVCQGRHYVEAVKK